MARASAPAPLTKVQATAKNVELGDVYNASEDVKLQLANEHQSAVEEDVSSWEHWHPNRNTAEQWNQDQWVAWKATKAGRHSGSYYSGSYSGSYHSGSWK